MGMFDSVLESVKGMINDSMAGVETKAHQFISDEEAVAMRTLRSGLIGTLGYALLIHRFAPQYGNIVVFAAPLLYITTIKAVAGREGFILAAGVGVEFIKK